MKILRSNKSFFAGYYNSAAALVQDGLLAKTDYISGHPQMGSGAPVRVVDTANAFVLKNHFKDAVIMKYRVTGVAVEDRTTVARREGLKRQLIVGLFALAWKKQVNHAATYLVIEWYMDKVQHETILEFKGKDCLAEANTAKHKMIRSIGYYEDTREECNIERLVRE